MNVSFAVQAHPSRSLIAKALAYDIGGTVVWDPDPDGRKAAWRSFRLLMETTPGNATHRVQIQDDATICPGFRDAAHAAIRAQPDRLLVFYVGTQHSRHTNAVLNACKDDLAWAVLPTNWWVPVVATCWPRPMITGLLDFVDRQSWGATFVADDEIVGRYIQEHGVAPLATVPSLVEHTDEIPSVHARNGQWRQGAQQRRAACWVGDCVDCVEGIDWTRGP